MADWCVRLSIHLFFLAGLFCFVQVWFPNNGVIGGRHFCEWLGIKTSFLEFHGGIASDGGVGAGRTSCAFPFSLRFRVYAFLLSLDSAIYF